METLFKVALVGRPNVGKSTLFNKIIGRRKAFTFRKPGITRDFISEKITFQDRTFELLDTGGYTPGSDEEIHYLVVRQVLRAVEESDLVVLLLDGKEGISSIDREIVDILREREKEFIVALNKVDYKKFTDTVPSVYELGVERIFELSAEHGTGVLELMEEIAGRAEIVPRPEEGPEALGSVCIVGRPNVGKSTLVNSLLGDERIITSPQPGTTRDSIDTEIIVKGEKMILVDTAGMRPRRKTADAVEKIMSIRSMKSIKNADVAILVVDASEGATHQDQQIMRYILEEKKGALVAANKIDLIDRKGHGEALLNLEESLRFAAFVPIVMISALKNTGLDSVMLTLRDVFSQYVKKVRTSELNREAERFLYNVTIPGSRRPNRAYYITQTGVSPPAFTIFVKDPVSVPESFQRYVSNKIRDRFGFQGCPIILRFRRK